MLSYSDVNLQYGQAVGDALLYEAAQYLEQLYPQGRAFQISNMVFALVLPWNSTQEANEALETIHARFQQPWVLKPDLAPRIQLKVEITEQFLLHNAPSDQQAELMLKALITMFYSLGKRVIAEGVETESQATYLRQCGSDMIQGFMPVPCPQIN